MYMQNLGFQHSNKHFLFTQEEGHVLAVVLSLGTNHTNYHM